MVRRASSVARILVLAAGLGLVSCATQAVTPSPEPGARSEAVAKRSALSANRFEEAEGSREDLNDLSQQVEALLVMFYLDVTPAQMQQLAKIAKETAAKARERKPAKASEKYRKVVVDLRDALVKGDADKTTDLAEKLDDLRESDKADLDDDFDMTDAARQRAPEIVRQLSVAQMLAYVTNYEEDLTDPLETMREVMKEGRTLKGQEWKDYRDEAAEEVARQIAGLNTEKVAKVRDQVIALFDRAYGLKDADYKTQSDELAQAARDLMGKVGPTDVLRHSMEYTVAELLSNPQLAEVLEARLKTVKK